LNRGPHDYESCALTSWAISPSFYCHCLSYWRCKSRGYFWITQHFQ